MTKRTAGFSLIEIAIVVLVIGILAAIAVPLFKQATRRSVVSTLENDLRVLSQQFLNYNLELSSYPPTEHTAGVYPEGMEERLNTHLAGTLGCRRVLSMDLYDRR